MNISTLEEKIELLLLNFNSNPKDSLETSLLLFHENEMHISDIYKAHLLFIIGSCNQLLLSYQRAMEFLKEALKYYSSINNIQGEISCLKNLGSNSYKSGKYAESFSFFYRALELADHNKKSKRSIFVNLGVISFEIGRIFDALEYYYLAFKTLKEKDLDQRSIILNNFGECYYKLKEFDKALYHFEEAIKIFKQLGHTHHLAYSYTESTELLIEMEYLDRAEGYLYLAMELNRSIESPAISIKCLRNKGLLALKRAQLDNAEKYLNESMALSKQFDDKLSQSQCLYQLKEIYKIQNRPEKALDYFEQYHFLSLELNKIEIQNAMEMMSSRIEIDALKKEKAQTESQNQQLLNLNEEVILINNLAQEITGSLDLYEIAAYLNRIITDMFHPTQIAIGIHQPENNCLAFDHIFNRYKKTNPFSISLENKKNPACKAFIENKPLCFLSEEEIGDFINLEKPTEFQSIAYIPLRMDDQSLGLLLIQSTDMQAFNQNTFNLLCSLSPFISISVCNALNHQKIHQLNQCLSADKNELEHAYDEIEYLACHDPLTGLANRSLLEDYFLRCSNICKRNNETIALVFIDLDGFKDINDNFGHEIGDKVLVIISKRLQENIRQSDMATRYGGDEFVIILREIHNLESIHLLVEKLRDSIEHPMQIDNYSCHVGASIGLARYPKEGSTLDQLLNTADQRMYNEKRNRKRQLSKNGI